MRDRKVQEILLKLTEKASELHRFGLRLKSDGVYAAISIIANEVKILEDRKRERFTKKLIREENTEKYREDLYG